VLQGNWAETAFRDAFVRAAGKDNVPIVVHTALWSFGHHFGADVRRLPETLLRLMREAVGPRRTIGFPTYSFSFCRNGIFDLLRTKGEVGALNEYARRQTDALRTRQPIYSYVFTGPDSGAFADIRATTAWGAGSAMELMERINVRQVVVGVDWHLSASIIHRAEELEQVPYRYFKRFPGELLCDGRGIGPVQEVFFVRAEGVMPAFDYGPATQVIHRLSSRTHGGSDDFMMDGCDTRDIVAASRQLLLKDPYAFVTNRADLEEWVRSTRESEINALLPHQRV
jgi:aminoglycoside N3'-acetyltransferase